MMIGIISDTPSLLRPEASARLAGVDHIIHAGDIGRPEVIAGLRALAPTTAIRGNIDTGRWAKGYGNNSTAPNGPLLQHVPVEDSQRVADLAPPTAVRLVQGLVAFPAKRGQAEAIATIFDQ